MRTRNAVAYWIVVALQVAAVVTYAGAKELSLRQSYDVILATAPVDPRDLFRGDYVILAYEVSRIDNCWMGDVGEDVYVPLRPEADKWVAENPASDYAGAAQRSDIVMKGKVVSQNRGTCQLVYGIESYYVPEGTGRNIERLRGQLRVRVAVNGYGDAILRELILPR
jgi:uncharacterized membrane-anchored protein